MGHLRLLVGAGMNGFVKSFLDISHFSFFMCTTKDDCLLANHKANRLGFTAFFTI